MDSSTTFIIERKEVKLKKRTNLKNNTFNPSLSVDNFIIFNFEEIHKTTS